MLWCFQIVSVGDKSVTFYDPMGEKKERMAKIKDSWGYVYNCGPLLFLAFN
jgi:hypothetical protein